MSVQGYSSHENWFLVLEKNRPLYSLLEGGSMGDHPNLPIRERNPCFRIGNPGTRIVFPDIPGVLINATATRVPDPNGA